MSGGVSFLVDLELFWIRFEYGIDVLVGSLYHCRVSNSPDGYNEPNELGAKGRSQLPFFKTHIKV